MPRRFESSSLVIATHNAGKVKEIAELLGDRVETITAAGALGLPEPDETGATFAENAKIKALAAALASGQPALADDSGLSVAALEGAPGIYSARWAGENKDFEAAMRKVEAALGNAEDRSAAFICALCLAWPDGHTEVFEGMVEGRLEFPPRGTRGFGYDPIFVPRGYPVTFAEMSPPEKQGISHRARAFQLLIKGCFNAP